MGIPLATLYDVFQSTPPREGVTYRNYDSRQENMFQSTPPREGVTGIPRGTQ